MKGRRMTRLRRKEKRIQGGGKSPSIGENTPAETEYRGKKDIVRARELRLTGVCERNDIVKEILKSKRINLTEVRGDGSCGGYYTTTI